MDGKHDLIYPCDCGDDHFLRLTWWDDDGYPECEMDGYLHLGGGFGRRARWRRVLAAGRVLTGRHYDTYVGIVLDGPTARSAAAGLAAYAVAWDKAREDRAQNAAAENHAQGGAGKM